MIIYCSIFLNKSSNNQITIFSFRMTEDVDFKKTKRTYPRTLNDSILEFVFEPDPNLYMRKNNIQIFGTIELPEDVVPDVGFAVKMFSMFTVEVNSQLVSNNRNQ